MPTPFGGDMGFFLVKAEQQICAFLYIGFFGIVRKFHDIRNIAMKNFAENINCMGTDTFVSLQACDLCRTDSIVVDKGILRDAPLFHHIPEVVIGNHNTQVSLST